MNDASGAGNFGTKLDTSAGVSPADELRSSSPAVEQQSRGKRPGTGSQRDAFLDNAKYLLIVLVAVAHSWEAVEGSRATTALYMFVYAFHMPAFIVICGYLSRSYTGRPHQLRRLVTGIAVPYVVFEVAYSLFKRYADDSPDHAITLLDPFFLTWFLAALLIWRLTSPLWRHLRHPLPVALGIAALASLAPGIGDDLNLQRVLQFLPFFVLGLRLKPQHFAIVRRREARLLALPVLAGALLFAYWVAPRMKTGWLFRTNSAQQLDAPWWSGPVMTLLLFGCSLLLTAAFLSWVPRRHLWFTVLGAGTICGYLLHGFAIKGPEYAGVFDTYTWLSEPAGKVAVSLAAAIAVTLMCTPPVRRALRPVTEPDMTWAFRDIRGEQRPEGPPMRSPGTAHESDRMARSAR
ncbi:acyltransferase family protein [Streptomyces sp. ADI93-02]|uniref:acyltransferase family protein n=1 Tax=Streptomyces sp. ADI93-02 TaxID=1522757 RepID=UPI000F553338|nr:acyltransferase family protein [Streptomyces sp. ADI93-02]RPK43330.1 glucans biosynthesis protein [Streptomyces sp. ADI93-02]